MSGSVGGTERDSASSHPSVRDIAWAPPVPPTNPAAVTTALQVLNQFVRTELHSQTATFTRLETACLARDGICLGKEVQKMISVV